MTAPVRIGLVGCGRLAAEAYVPAAASSPAVVIAAVADRDARRRAEVAAAAGGVPAHADAAALLDAGGLDAVVLATPAAAHLADARLAADLGLPVLVEKPPAPDLEGARALAALHPAPRIAFNRRFDPALGEMRAAATGDDPLDIDLELRYRRASWGAHVVRDEVLLDLGPHLVDLAAWLTGAPLRRLRVRERTHDRAEIVLGGDRGRVRIACAADRAHLERFTVRRDGRLVGDVRSGGVVRGALGRLRPPGEHPLVDGVRRELEAFARHVHGDEAGAAPLAAAEDGAAVMAVLDAARAPEAAAGAWVAIELPRIPHHQGA